MQQAHMLMDEILMATVVRKEWHYKRIAHYVVSKQIEILEELPPTIEITDKIIELQHMLKAIAKLKV